MRKVIWMPFLALALSAGAQSNIVFNGGFEINGATLSGWSSTEGYGWESATTTAAEGSVFAFVTGNPYQDLPTVPGQVYRLRCAVSGDPFWQGPTTLETYWAGSLAISTVFDTTGHSNENLGWIYVTNKLLATASTTRLWFANPGYGVATIPLLDAVSAVAVDEFPTTCIPPADGIISWWPGRSNALDVAGANHGAVLNGVSFATGIVGPAFSFNGSNQCIRVPYASSLVPSNYSIEAWVQPLAQITDPSTQSVVFAQNNGHCQLLLRPGNSGLRVALQFAVDPSTSIGLESTNEIPLGQFGHVAGTWDGTNLSLYLNGVLDSQTAPGFVPMDSGCPFFLGGIYYTNAGACSNVAGFFNGLIDEASYYQRALSETELHAIFLAGSQGKCAVPRPPAISVQPAGKTVYAGSTVIFTVNATGDAPLGYQWRLNGVNLTGATSNSLTFTNVQAARAGNYSVLLNNAAGSALSSNALLTVLPAPPCAPIPPGLISWWRAENDLLDDWDSNDGTLLRGSPAFLKVGFVAGKVGAAFSFGTNGVLISDNASLRPTNGLTIEGWVNPSVAGPSPRTIFSKFDSLSPFTNSSYYLGASNGLLVLKVSSTGRNMTTLFTTQPLPLGLWTHVAATYDGGTLRLYVNGAVSAQTNYSAGIFPGTFDAGLGALPLQQSSWVYPWAGYLDEISLYNRALSDGEIAGIYNADLTGKCFSPPIITVQPQSQAVPLNEDAVFLAAVVGSKPLRYQWRFNGTNLPGAVSSRLLLEKVQSNLVGSYSVVVTNSLGRATSSPAALTLLPALNCVSAPTGLVAWWPGNNFANDVIGTNNATLVVVRPPGFAGYTTGKVGQTFSFTNGYAFVSNPPQLNFALGDFSIETWFKTFPTNGAAPFDSSPLQLSIVQKMSFTPPIFPLPATAVGYSLILDNGRLACQLASSSFITNIPTFISTGPDLRDGMFHHLALTVARNPLNSCHLFVDGQVVLTFDPRSVRGSLSNSAGLTIGDTAPGSFGSSGPNQRIDELAIYNRALSTSEILAVRQAGSAGKCIPPPNILVQPTNQIVNAGNAATLRVLASGFPPIIYQWLKNGTNQPGATNTALLITNATRADAGPYALTLGNVGGSVTSAVATLIVNQPPTASNMIAATKQNQRISIPIQKLLLYAADADGDPLSLSAVSGTSTNGGTVLRSPTDVSYTPATNFIGSDSFTWTVTDGRSGFASALMLIQVRATNEISGNMLALVTVPGGFRVSFAGVPGVTYTLQRAEAVFGPWNTLTSVLVGADGIAAFDDTNSPPPTAYYRTVYP